MIKAAKNYLTFLYRCVAVAFVGDWRYYLWMGTLTVFCLLGLNAYAKQFVNGLVTTGMTDQVSWGVYIANFTFLVGVAAAAVMLVIPVYVYGNEDLHDLVIFGELLAVAAILMCLAFVTVDLGRPDRFWHLIPGLGKFNFPGSMLSWDVIVLNGYLLLNVHICGYLIYCRYQNRKPAKWFYIPFVFIGIVWAVSIHTVTAFLYVGLGGRPFWNSAIVGPRFIASAFTAGPALIILALRIVRRVTGYRSQALVEPVAGAEAPTDLSDGRPATVKDLDALARVLPDLDGVSPETRAACARGAMVFQVAAGGVITRRGATETDAYFILSGSASAGREENGRFRAIQKFRSGDVVGIVSAVQGGVRNVSVVAEQASVVLRLPASAIETLMEHPRMYRFLSERTAHRVEISDKALMTLRSVVQVSMLINVFLLVNEVFKEFYTGNLHVASARYLFLGLHGHHALVPWIWTAVGLNLTAMFLLILPVSRSLRWLDLACVLCIIGIWIEKGMGLVIPGFVPTPLGEIVEYTPSLNETLICLGIWAFGFLSYTIFLRMTVPVLQGTINKSNERPAAAGRGADRQVRNLLDEPVPSPQGPAVD